MVDNQLFGLRQFDDASEKTMHYTGKKEEEVFMWEFTFLWKLTCLLECVLMLRTSTTETYFNC